VSVETETLGLRSRITCPHCWNTFPPAETLWVSTHPALHGDARLGNEVQRRFLPTRFDPSGNAIDSHGSSCSDVACPKCHLVVPRAVFEIPCLFYSILGSPGSGKSHFLATTTWQLRQTLGNDFKLSISDADPAANRLLNEAEERLFFNESPGTLTTLPKTEKEGELYQPVQYGDQTVWYPRPFVFTVQPLPGHPRYEDSAKISRAICVYDNAGEHFMPGGQSSISPATQHLTVSRGLIILFDPTQHTKFREACQGKTTDPQMDAEGRSHRQDQVLLEAANRIRTQAGLSQNQKYTRPLIVAMTKMDSWGPTLWPDPIASEELIRPSSSGRAGLHRQMLEDVSGEMRKLMSRYAPEFVNAAEGFAESVYYIPMSALGQPPVIDPETGMLGIRPADIAPKWAEVPLLFLLNLTSGGLIPSLTTRTR